MSTEMMKKKDGSDVERYVPYHIHRDRAVVALHMICRDVSCRVRFALYAEKTQRKSGVERRTACVCVVLCARLRARCSCHHVDNTHKQAYHRR